jgi:hypothetical protein
MLLNLFLFTIAMVNADYSIVGNHSFCHQTELLLDIDQKSQFYIEYNILRLHDDEFNYIHLDCNTIVVYSNYGQLYSTMCMLINEISIPFVVDTCTFDLPVYYIRDNIKNPLFLTKTGILRNNTALVRCSQEPSVFSLGKEVVKVMNKTAKINEKKSIDLLKLINYKNKFSNDSHNESYTFFDFYFQNFAKNKVFITIRDKVEYIFMAVVVFLFKNKYSSLIIFILKKSTNLKL